MLFRKQQVDGSSPSVGSTAYPLPHISDGHTAVRVLVLIKATADSEAGVMPSAELIDAMGRYNEELVEAVE